MISKRWEYEINAIAHDIGGSPVLVSGKEATIQSLPAKTGTFTITDSAGHRTTGTLMTVLRGASLTNIITASNIDATPDTGEQQRTFVKSFRFLDEPAPQAPTCDLTAGTGKA